MEIRQVYDPQAVELVGQPGDGELQLAQPHPAGLEVAPAEPGRRSETEEGTGAAPEGIRAGFRPSAH